jgi:uncharacterized protein (DUF58 family)
MKGYLIFIYVSLILVLISYFTRTNGFKNLKVKRTPLKDKVYPGEEFEVVTEVENNKRLPIAFFYMEEELPRGVERLSHERFDSKGDKNYYTSSYSIWWYERIKRIYKYSIDRRGVYFFRKIDLSIGDFFGLSYERKSIDDFVEIVVYPRLLPLKELELKTNSLQGNNIIKRWIYKDPIYIKGIREYSVEDRMKDIHWKSSLRMNKLMVKDYDYTSEREVVIIVNVQCGEPYWSFIDPDTVDNTVEVAAAMAKQCVEEGIPVGMWANAQIIGRSKREKAEVISSMNSFRAVMELCGRIDSTPKLKFDEYLMERLSYFKKEAFYFIATPFLSDEAVYVLSKLHNRGFNIKILDTSRNANLPNITGVEKIDFKRGWH